MTYHARDVDKINEILHFSHAIPSFAKLFSKLTEHYRSWKPFLSNTKPIGPDIYLASPEVNNLLHWMRKYILLGRFLDARRYYVDQLADTVQKLHSPLQVTHLTDFEHLFQRFQHFADFLDSEIKTKSKRLDCAECVRLDEALVCYENYAYNASVIMAVSAVEGRITELIRRTNLRLYNSHFSKFTLGQLISVFDPAQYTDKKYSGIKKLIPDRHRPLVTLLNQYRIFSAHPKGEPITAQIADSMLHLSFAFMLDETTCPYTEKELKHR